MKEYEYYKPKNLKEACDLLIKYNGKANILNGGTDIIVRMRDGHSTPEALIDIKGINELHKLDFDYDRGLFIGACVNLNELGLDGNVQKYYPFLAQAALSVGSKQVRNRATCIGNICNASPLADTATPLMVLDATISVYGPEGEREIPISEFFVFVRKTVLKENEIVKGIKIPYKPNILGIFYKMSRRKEVDLSTVCSTVVKEENKIKIAFGAVAPTPVRLYKTEEYLDGCSLNDIAIEQACQMAAEEVAPIDDLRASKEYRKEMVRVMLRRSLVEFL